MAGAMALGAILSTLVVGADRFDPLAFAGSAVIVTLVAIVATFALCFGQFEWTPIRCCGWSDNARWRRPYFDIARENRGLPSILRAAFSAWQSGAMPSSESINLLAFLESDEANSGRIHPEIGC
jgi:hypothetical protein